MESLHKYSCKMYNYAGLSGLQFHKDGLLCISMNELFRQELPTQGDNYEKYKRRHYSCTGI